jgi:hypothetical protein
MWAVRGASRLDRPGKTHCFWSMRKRLALQTMHFSGVLTFYKWSSVCFSRMNQLRIKYVGVQLHAWQ